jgi:methylenetetrahydrofolate reductase (NADPH)
MNTDSRVAELLASPRYEVLPFGDVEEAVLEHVPTDVTLTVTVSPRKGIEHTLDVAERFGKHGYRVVPHISARLVRDRSHLAEILQRVDAIGAHDVFVVAGDADEPAGEYGGGAALLEAIAELGHRFEDVGITGYPESHPLISDEATIQAMFDKARFATYIVSQICFDPTVTSSWIERVWERGTRLPIYIGIPGAVPRIEAAAHLVDDRDRRLDPLPPQTQGLARAGDAGLAASIPIRSSTACLRASTTPRARSPASTSSRSTTWPTPSSGAGNGSPRRRKPSACEHRATGLLDGRRRRMGRLGVRRARRGDEPRDGEVLGTVPSGTREDAQRAIASANAARRDWAARSAFERAAAMERSRSSWRSGATTSRERSRSTRGSRYTRRRTTRSTSSLRTGAWPPPTRRGLAGVDAARRWTPPSASSSTACPRGVVGAITPWNWPYTMPAEVIAPALAAGNAVVWVPLRRPRSAR